MKRINWFEKAKHPTKVSAVKVTDNGAKIGEIEFNSRELRAIADCLSDKNDPHDYKADVINDLDDAAQSTSQRNLNKMNDLVQRVKSTPAADFFDLMKKVDEAANLIGWR